MARDPALKNTPNVDIYISAPAQKVLSPQDSLLSTFTPMLCLMGAHGEEVVRDIWFEDEVSTISLSVTLRREAIIPHSGSGLIVSINSIHL